MDFASLVHHCCIPVSNNSIFLLGGGVPSFSFGEENAKSHHLIIDAMSSIATVNGSETSSSEATILQQTD
jgi:hypothetical protein